MKSSVLLLIATFACVSSLWSQGERTADQAFSELEMFARPINARPVPPGGKKTRAEFEEDRKRQSMGFLFASGKAREFYTQNAAHPKAVEAKKIEVISLLRAVQTGAIEQEPRALRLARDFRADAKNPSRARYDVAATVNQIEISKKNIRDQALLLEEYERRAYDLYGEFSDEPAIFEMLLGIARSSSPEKARALVQRIHLMPAPAEIKAQAQAIIDRLDMPGKALALEWQDENGESRTIADYKGKVVVFYIWATWAAGGEAMDPKVAEAIKSGVELISVNVDTDVEKGKAAKSKSMLSQPGYFDARGPQGPLPKQLKAAQAPAVHVVDANGIYIGSGVPDRLPDLLAKASAQQTR